MTFSFHKGKHRSRPIYWLGWFPFLYKPKTVQRKLWLDSSCKYALGTEDQWDVNKLFGLALTLWSVHKDSIRVGYRYNPDNNKFEVFAYWYTKGARSFQKICDIVAFRSYICKIELRNKDCRVSVVQYDNLLTMGAAEIPLRKQPVLSLLLGPFFGGNRPAPHNMEFKLDKI